jgi:hypothetical protein
VTPAAAERNVTVSREADRLALIDRERDVVDGDDPAESLGRCSPSSNAILPNSRQPLK